MLKSQSRGGVQSLAWPVNGVFTEDTGELEDNISSSIIQMNVVFVIMNVNFLIEYFMKLT